MKAALPPDIFFLQEQRLMVFRPRGILDQKAVLQVVRYLDKVEDLAQQPFNRFTDTSKLDALDLDERFVYRIALHRRRFYMGHPPVKSAFYVTSRAARHYVQIHAVVTAHSPLRVKLFTDLDDAAEWLGVPRGRLDY